MPTTVKIRLRKPRRVFTFYCEDLALQRDEPCIVESDRGLEYGTCILPPEPCPPQMAERFTMKVIRRVSDEDTATQQEIEAEEKKARQMCLEKIRGRNMPMKLVDVEYTFDRQKVVFYFTAEDRVDFRELVRDLAHDLRTRIELRHIQVRDEAKMVGGIGSCGRELCCSTWLNEFKPISMRMAKRQNLSLNPTKISGQCGRLLCCLSYENELYEEERRRARKAAEEQRAAEKAAAARGELPVETEAAPPQQRADRPERRDRPERQERPDRRERPERPDRRDRPAPRDRSDSPDTSDSSDRSERPERPPRPERPERDERLRPEPGPPQGTAEGQPPTGEGAPAEGEKRDRPRKRRRRKKGGFKPEPGGDN